MLHPIDLQGASSDQRNGLYLQHHCQSAELSPTLQLLLVEDISGWLKCELQIMLKEQQWLILINLIVTMYCLCLVEQQHKDTGVCRYGVMSLQGHGICGVCQVEFLWIQREQSVVWWFTQRGFDSQARQRRVEWDLQVKDKYKSGSLL